MLGCNYAHGARKRPTCDSQVDGRVHREVDDTELRGFMFSLILLLNLIRKNTMVGFKMPLLQR